MNDNKEVVRLLSNPRAKVPVSLEVALTLRGARKRSRNTTLFETDSQGNLVRLNPAWSRSVGYTASECLGKPLVEFVFDDDCGMCRRIVREVTFAKGSRSIRLRRAEASAGWVDVSVVPLAGGGLAGALGEVSNGLSSKEDSYDLVLSGVSTDGVVLIAEQDAKAEMDSRPKVLVAEDTNSSYDLVRMILERAGYWVMRAVDGRGAVAAAAQADLILMDIEMPEMDGLEATQRIRQCEQLEGRAPVPILALTGRTVEGHRERCLAAGCTEYHTKPFQKDLLLAAIEQAIASSRRVS
jgi:PAS domain S-box-containing protein